jgi:hypothetical protein
MSNERFEITLEEVLERFEAAFHRGERPSIAEYLRGMRDCDATTQSKLLRELLRIELESRAKLGDSPSVEEYRRRFPEQAEWISQRIGDDDTKSWVDEGGLSAAGQDWVTPTGDRVTPTAELGGVREGHQYPTDRLVRESSRGRDTLDLIGQRLASLDRYVVLRRLGEGGWGSVWLVQRSDSGETRALKVLHPRVADNPSVQARFKQETEILRKLQHPSAVMVYDAGIVNNLAYIEMEYVRGQNLRQILSYGPPRPLHWVWVDIVLSDVCGVLGRAHELGIIHCDLKPANIMMQTNGVAARARVKVLDFGIAMMFGHEGSMIGTPAYMSPEQIKGLSERNGVDARSDLYAIGVILYEMLTGSRPFSGPVTKLLHEHLNTSAPRFAEKSPRVEVPPALEELVLRCLDKDPAARPQSASELFDQFRKATEGRQSHEKLATPVPMIAPSESALPAAGVLPKVEGQLGALLRRLGRSVKKAFGGSASAGTRALEAKADEGERPAGTETAPGTIRCRADVSFPAQVLVGQPNHLSIQLVPIEHDVPGVRPSPHDGGWPLNFLALSFSSFGGTPASSALEVIVSLAAENFEVNGTGRAGLIARVQGFSSTVQFSLRGIEVGPGRVMIDFAQGGRPIGSLDLMPEVVATIGAQIPSSPPASAAGAPTLHLHTGPIPPPPDVVIKVFEHRLAGHAGRLQFVLSSTHQALSDLPVLDGDLGTLDLRTEVVDWVGDQLRAVGAVAEKPDVTAEEAERSLARIGFDLFRQLLPLPLKNHCWTFRERGVKAVMVLSDEPHIPWELIKPYRDNPRTGEFEEDEFWGQSYALTHWLRGRPPVRRLSFKRICALAATVDRPPLGQPAVVRDMAPPIATPASDAESSTHAASIAVMPIGEEIEVLRSLEASGSRVRILPARRQEILSLLEQGEFDVLHLITHGDFAGLSAADASAVHVEDGAFLANELSPRMAAALRRAAPLIFFNTCHSGRIGFSLTRLGSWGARLVELGCGGFIGTLWPVTDQAAAAFAQVFYELMSEGLPIGEVMLRARHQVRTRFPNDPTWLAYCCFADPWARIERTPEASAPEATEKQHAH